MVAFGLAPDLVVALGAYWVYALARGAARPVKSAWLTQQIDPEVRATVLSMSGQVDALGQIAGGPAIGAIGNASLRAAIVVAGLALAPALPLYARAAGQGRDLAPDETAVVDGEAEAVGRSPGP
jgi:DHA3 family tetracycline resistance protein-like MFS transporter